MTHDIDNLAAQAYYDAVRRGKTSVYIKPRQEYRSILAELKEFRKSREYLPSEHLPGYTQAAEELADLMICCMTELHKRNVTVSEILKKKINFNKTRD